ncbi:DUF6702 family protein [Aquimarina spongiae]|uniref:GLPGLI family protein n=1 Tax=Aquimarina spongiae TaxID=570521 RepID=A0A1M6KYT3_9FLAO|nr:hypothetical protein SAMN04488508_11317 [Aquimarina spongiae]
MKHYKILLLLCLSFLSTSFNSSHPIKLTSSLIEHNAKTNTFVMECRLFIDDFTFSINDTFTKNINLSNLSKTDIKGIESYFARYYKVSINDEYFPFKYKSSEVMEKQNVISIKFYRDIPKIEEGDQICIENTLFFEEFGFLQSNRITLRLPPFIEENYFDITSFDEPISLNL